MSTLRCYALRSLALSAVLCLLVALGSCGGNGSADAQLTAAPELSAGVVELNKALAELASLPVPAGADKVLFAELKDKLRAMLLSKGVNKLAAAAPSSSRSKPGFFTLAGSGGTASLYWTYRNEGDFNLDGVVSIADLAPLGIHFGKDSSAGDWSSARPADGNVDGVVNISDLVCIGANFTRIVQGYFLQYSTSYSGGSWSNVADIGFSASQLAASGGFRIFDIDVTSGMADGFYRIVPYHGTDEGIPSDVVAYPATNYYEAEDNDDGPGANPLPAFPFPMPIVDGNLGTGNYFGDVDGDDTDNFFRAAPADGTFDYRLSLDGALGDIDLFLFQAGVTDPIASSRGYGDKEHVNVAVTGGTTYYVMMRRYSGYGEYRLEGSFTPGGVNIPPTADLVANPGAGAAPLTVTLDAGGSTDTDGSIVKYEYDFGEGAGFQDLGTDISVVHNYTTPGNYSAQVRVTDSGGLTDTDNTTVNVTGGGDSTISGTVLTDVGRPLLGVSVSLTDGSNFVTVNTDVNGVYQFFAVPPGNYTVTPSLFEDSFEPASRSVNLAGSPVGGQDFTAHYVSTITPYEFRSGDPPSTVVHPALGTTIDIYIENGSAVTGWYQGLEDAVRTAVVRWNIVGDPWNLFHVQFTDNIDNAEIWIHYVQSLGGNRLGQAYWSGTNYQINLPMEIQMATYVGANQVDAPTEEMGAIHEVGHTLGLWSHSTQDTDIMYPIATQSWPSLRDMWTIYTLYHTPPDWTTGGRGGSGAGGIFMEYRTD